MVPKWGGPRVGAHPLPERPREDTHSLRACSSARTCYTPPRMCAQHAKSFVHSMLRKCAHFWCASVHGTVCVQQECSGYPPSGGIYPLTHPVCTPYILGIRSAPRSEMRAFRCGESESPEYPCRCTCIYTPPDAYMHAHEPYGPCSDAPVHQRCVHTLNIGHYCCHISRANSHNISPISTCLRTRVVHVLVAQGSTSHHHTLHAMQQVFWDV